DWLLVSTCGRNSVLPGPASRFQLGVTVKRDACTVTVSTAWSWTVELACDVEVIVSVSTAPAVSNVGTIARRMTWTQAPEGRAPVLAMGAPSEGSPSPFGSLHTSVAHPLSEVTDRLSVSVNDWLLQVTCGIQTSSPATPLRDSSL